MLITEFRIVMPVTLDEYQTGQLYSTGEASKLETGGGEGIQVVTNEPFSNKPIFHGQHSSGQYTHKIFYLHSKVPGYVRMIMPNGALVIHESSWNSFPYCKTVLTNPDYMKEKFRINVETMHLADRGETENAHNLTVEELEKREVVIIDIANDTIAKSDYKADQDPTTFKSVKTGRGPLSGDWSKTVEPVMCCYKLVRAEFVWFGLQGRIERFVMAQEKRVFTNFHRQAFCWLDKWSGMTMDDIRQLEVETQKLLDEERAKGQLKGTTANNE